MNISIKQKQTHKENRFVVAKEGGCRERGFVWCKPEDANI